MTVFSQVSITNFAKFLGSLNWKHYLYRHCSIFIGVPLFAYFGVTLLSSTTQFYGSKIKLYLYP